MPRYPLRTTFALASALCSCATPLPALRERALVATPTGNFTIEFSEGDGTEETKIQSALNDATPKLEIWGGAPHPIRILILPNHRALEQAVDKPDYSWLKAWARYDEIFLQSPKTWGLGASEQAELNSLLLHELVHCVMYQLSATKTSWHRKEIPLWFREGMASFTAGQGYQFAALEDLARFYEANPTQDPLLGSEALYREQSSIVYGAGHHAFEFLMKRYGRDSVVSIMKTMSAGATFPVAFRGVLGISAEAFSEDFRRYVQWRGFRDARSEAYRSALREAAAGL